MPERNNRRDHQRKHNQKQRKNNHYHKKRSHNADRFSECPPDLNKQNLDAISAPYNFVPLADWVHIPEWSRQVSHDWPFKDGFSGEISYKLTADSPLLVGGRQEKNKDPHRPNTEVSPFRLPDGRYAIPGSSLKGMIRSVVEIAGFGRMRMVDDARPGLRDISGPHVKEAYTNRVRNRVKAGFLKLREDGGREIIPCRMIRLPHRLLEGTLHKNTPIFTKGMKVSDKYALWEKLCDSEHWDPYSIPFADNGQEAILIGPGSEKVGFPVFTGQISDSREDNGKKRDFIFYAPNESNPIQVDDTDWRDFLRIHGDDESNKNSSMPWIDYWKSRFRQGKKVPVFYIYENGRIQLGLAYMPKLAGDFGIHDCITHASEDHLHSAPGVGRYDLADLLFGAINGDDQNDALRGRVSFETAIATTNLSTAQSDTILNGPKPTYFPNYLHQDTDQTGLRLKGDEKTQYSTYVSTQNNKKPRIRGFKRYPARPIEMTRAQKITPEQQKNKKIQIRLNTLPQGATFKGRIRFHNLKPQELGVLLWVLTWGNDHGLRHGLGMGKPFGFGQVHFQIDNNNSYITPNEPHEKSMSLDEAKQKELIKAFEDHMESVAKIHGGWKESPQIRNLLAMADPEAAEDLPDGMKLQHMRLMRCKKGNRNINGNEFLWAKQKALVLADYADATGWPGEATQKRWQAARSTEVADEVASNSDLHIWLQKALSNVISNSQATDLAALMRHKNLFKTWNNIENPALKKEVFDHIQHFWNAQGWWKNPPNRTMREIKQKYEKEAARL